MRQIYQSKLHVNDKRILSPLFDGIGKMEYILDGGEISSFVGMSLIEKTEKKLNEFLLANFGGERDNPKYYSKSQIEEI